MAHREHNRRGSGYFALIILGALLLFVAPGTYPTAPDLGVAALIGGLAVGGLGFYMRFVKNRLR
ncbi:MAG: hypothetical protein J4G04_04860 [Nitrosopumilaceae archaeon]|nr:hypothetical protein [Nitrosopumilaceae archaeon]